MSNATVKPWTRWWWMGSAVDELGIGAHLREYAAAGIGGVEITPIYGVPSRAAEWIPLLSPRWMQLLSFTAAECARLGMGCDLVLGSGWPWGGPMLSAEQAPKRVEFSVMSSGDFDLHGQAGEIVAAVAVEADGRRRDITGSLERIPDGLTLVLMRVLPTGQQVKRAAPGGAGHVMCPYSRSALEAYLAVFDDLFARFPAARPRCFFYDSFEVFGADYSHDLPATFKEVNGYALNERLPELAGKGDPAIICRVRADYRHALHRCLLDHSIRPWVQHSNEKGVLCRYQAHGAPGNLLDLYAAANVPETEVFGASTEIACVPRPADSLPLPREYPLVNRLASSAAHLSGQSLASSETFTWHREHFRGTLEEMKCETDLLWTTGINHLFFHGSTYSPPDAPWPGWLFYASTHVDIADPLWHDLPAFNAYVADVQSVLQAGRPSNDLLVYVPWFDLFAMESDSLLRQFTVHHTSEWVAAHDWGRWSQCLQDAGYGFDFVSDDLLAGCEAKTDWVEKCGNRWKAIVVPPCRFIPVRTLEKLIQLAAAGIPVILGSPRAVSAPGMRGLESGESAAFESAMNRLSALTRPGNADRLRDHLAAVGVFPVYTAEVPLRVIRRELPEGDAWFIANLSDTSLHGPVCLRARRPLGTVTMVDVVSGRRGRVSCRETECRAILHLPPGQSLLIRPSAREETSLPLWRDAAPCSTDVVVKGAVRVEFLSGGPSLPPAYTTDRIRLWTERAEQAYRDFSGTARYTFEIYWAGQPADDVRLSFNQVRASARVRVNGSLAGTLWCRPHQVRVGAFLKAGVNTIEVDVTNTAANRISAMDRSGTDWKCFGDINFVDLHYRPFNAANWETTPSGIEGPVHLTSDRKRQEDCQRRRHER